MCILGPDMMRMSFIYSSDELIYTRLFSPFSAGAGAHPRQYRVGGRAHPGRGSSPTLSQCVRQPIAILTRPMTVVNQPPQKLACDE